MPVTHDPHYLENALDVLLRCKQVVNDMEYHVCVELVKAWDTSHLPMVPGSS